MFHLIKNAYPVSGHSLIACFADGTSRTYDIRDIAESHPDFRTLEDSSLFYSLRAGLGGYGVIWDNDVDLSSEEIYFNGKPVKTPFDGFIDTKRASDLWLVDEKDILSAIESGRLAKGADACLFGSQWVVTIAAMEREFGPASV
ncbi:MAG: DUF2442 domain-containing protein [Clostridia bacterium]|nr:DUF2442 domain-containing protein [Clostridia bacterium]